MAKSKEIVIKIEGETDPSASGGAQIVECDSTGKADSLGPLAKGLKQNSTWNATVLNDTGTFTIPDILIPTYYLVRLVGTLPAIVKSDDLTKTGEIILKKDPKTSLENIDIITSIPVKPVQPTKTKDGIRFEYQINNDVQKSRVSVSLYGILQKNGKIVDDKLIATSAVKKYKKDSTGANSIDVIVTELLRQVIYDSEDLIIYKYNTYIDKDKVTKRSTENRTPSQITKAEAEYIPKPQKELSPFNLVNKQAAAESPFKTKAGASTYVESVGKYYDGAEGEAELSDKLNSVDPGTGKIVNNSTDASIKITNNSYTSDTDKSTTNSSKEITNSNQSNTATKVIDINKSLEAKTIYQDLLKDKSVTLSKEDKAYAQKAIKQLNVDIAKFYKLNPGAKKAKSAGVKAAVNSASTNMQVDLPTSDKDKPTSTESSFKASSGTSTFIEAGGGYYKGAKDQAVLTEKLNPKSNIQNQTGAGKAEPNPSTVITNPNIPGQQPDSYTKYVPKSGLNKDGSSYVDNLTKMIDAPLVSKLDTEKLSESGSSITDKSEKLKSAKSTKQPTVNVKKDNITKNAADVLKQKPTPIESKTVKELTALNTNITNLKQNPVNNVNGSQTEITNNNNNTKEAEMANTKLASTKKTSTGAKKTEEKSEPVDNSQAVLNSQLLHAIYDLLSTGIKVKHT